MSKDLVTPYSDRITISDAINELAGRDIPEEVVFEGEVYTSSEKTKLAGVDVAATANRADSLNANKSHKHIVSDITGLNTVIEGLEARILALESAGG